MYELAGLGEDIKGAFSDAGDYAKGLISPQRGPGARITGIGDIGRNQQAIENEYQRRLELFGQGPRNEEQFQFERQRNAILGAMQPSDAASRLAHQEALRSGQLAAGAARSQMGTAGTQLGALGALGAGQAQQAGLAGAAQVAAQEQQRNALVQAQLAEMLRQQELAQYGLARADVAQMLGAGRGLMASGAEIQQQAATEQSQRRNQMIGGILGGLAGAAGQLGGGQ